MTITPNKSMSMAWLAQVEGHIPRSRSLPCSHSLQPAQYSQTPPLSRACHRLRILPVYLLHELVFLAPPVHEPKRSRPIPTTMRRVRNVGWTRPQKGSRYHWQPVMSGRPVMHSSKTKTTRAPGCRLHGLPNVTHVGTAYRFGLPEWPQHLVRVPTDVVQRDAAPLRSGTRRLSIGSVKPLLELDTPRQIKYTWPRFHDLPGSTLS